MGLESDGIAQQLVRNSRLALLPESLDFSHGEVQIRRQIGNAVPPEGVRLLARKLKMLFQGSYEPVDLFEKS